MRKKTFKVVFIKKLSANNRQFIM